MIGGTRRYELSLARVAKQMGTPMTTTDFAAG